MKTITLCLTIMTVACSQLWPAMSKEDAAFEILCETGQREAADRVIAQTASPEKQHFLRSRRYFYDGDYAGAEAEIAAISGSSAPEIWLALLPYYAALAKNTAGFETRESEHFIFRARGADAVCAPYALDALERSWQRIGADLGCFPNDKVLVEMYPVKEEFSLASTIDMPTLEKSGTIGICKFNRIMLLSPQALPLGYRWLDALAHEYAHFITNRSSAGRCPLWFHEGVARYHDTRWRLDDPLFLSPSGSGLLKKAMDKKALVPFKKMHPSLIYLKDQAEISLAFAEVSSAVRFLRGSCGEESVRKLIAAFSTRDEQAAFSSVTGMSVAAFESRWKKFLQTLDLKDAPGAVPDQVSFEKKADEEFIGADLRGLVRLGDEMRRIGRPDAAVVQYEKALAAEPANPVILLKSARALRSAGRPEKAKEKLRAAITANPGYVTLYETLGGILLEEKDYAGAQGALEEALAMNPFNPQTHLDLAAAYDALGKPVEAQREAAACRFLLPEHRDFGR